MDCFNIVIKKRTPSCKRIIAIGDIHGMYDRLEALLNIIVFSPKEDMLIFMGDYIDRGNKSGDVVETVLTLASTYPKSVVLLCGNHEQMAHSAYYGTDDFDRKYWRKNWEDPRNGGLLTQASLGKGAPKIIKTLWEKCHLTYVLPKFIFSHASFPNVALKDIVSDHWQHLIWERNSGDYQGKRTLVVGHTPNIGRVARFNKSIVVDTGAYKVEKGGMLSALDVLNGVVYTSNSSMYRFET